MHAACIRAKAVSAEKLDEWWLLCCMLTDMAIARWSRYSGNTASTKSDKNEAACSICQSSSDSGTYEVHL